MTAEDYARLEDVVASSQHGQLLAEAIRVLTAAARLTRPVLERDEEASDREGSPVWRDSGRTEPADWAEFVTHALAGAAANIGSIYGVLAGRPGSWEADGVRNLLTSTVGHDEEYLLEHRTEPVVVELFVDELLFHFEVWQQYDIAQDELQRRYQAIGIPTFTSAPGWTDEDFARAGAETQVATEEQERQAEELAELDGKLQDLQRQDWTSYGDALKAAVLAAAARRPQLTVPVEVRVDLDTFRSDRDVSAEYSFGIVEELRAEAIAATPLPGDGRTPLERIGAADGTTT